MYMSMGGQIYIDWEVEGDKQRHHSASLIFHSSASLTFDQQRLDRTNQRAERGQREEEGGQEAGARQDKRAAKRVREKRVREKGARQKKSCTDRQESRGMFLV